MKIEPTLFQGYKTRGKTILQVKNRECEGCDKF